MIVILEEFVDIVEKDGDGIPVTLAEYVNKKVIELVSSLNGNCDSCKHYSNSGIYVDECDGCIRGAVLDNYEE